MAQSFTAPTPAPLPVPAPVDPRILQLFELIDYRLVQILNALNTLIRKDTAIMADLTALTAAVANETTVQQSAITPRSLHALRGGPDTLFRRDERTR